MNPTPLNWIVGALLAATAAVASAGPLEERRDGKDKDKDK